MPFITEKLWLLLVSSKSFLISQNYNIITFDQSFDESRTYIKKIIEIISSLRNLRANLNISYKTDIDIFIDTDNKSLKDFIVKYQSKIERLLKIKSIFYKSTTSQKKSAFIVLNDITILVPLEGVIDTDEEIAKLENKKKANNDKLKSIIDKLNNKAFIEKAPLNVIENFKIQEGEIKLSIEKINKIMNTIN